MNNTLYELLALKLHGLCSGLQEQLTPAGMTGASFEKRIVLMV